MEIEMRCVIHNVEYGFNRPPPNIDKTQFTCPQCAIESHWDMAATIKQLTTQRDALLAVIDLKKTQQPLKPSEKP